MSCPQTQVLLQQLSSALQKNNLWSNSLPSEEALSSQTPFAWDTLRFEQWLQFIFIPRMQALLDAKQPLPKGFAIAPAAAQAWSHQYADILQLLQQLDTLSA